MCVHNFHICVWHDIKPFCKNSVKVKILLKKLSRVHLTKFPLDMVTEHLFNDFSKNVDLTEKMLIFPQKSWLRFIVHCAVQCYVEKCCKTRSRILPKNQISVKSTFLLKMLLKSISRKFWVYVDSSFKVLHAVQVYKVKFLRTFCASLIFFFAQFFMGNCKNESK